MARILLVDLSKKIQIDDIERYLLPFLYAYLLLRVHASPKAFRPIR